MSATPALACQLNLGPKSQAWLAAVGITALEQLRQCGAIAAYAKARRAQAGVSLNLLWALEGALIGLPWQRVAREHRTRLLWALEQYDRTALVRPRVRAPAARAEPDGAGLAGRRS